MNKKKNFQLTRRDFIKTGTTLGLGTALVSDPYTPVLAEAMKIFDQQSQIYSFSCELIRPTDLLHFKYYFFNAEITSGEGKQFAERKNVNDEFFIYVKTPSQHIAEELETNISKVGSRADWQDENGKPKRKKSFLSGSSWLAFRVPTYKIELSELALLNWEANLELVTIDDFAQAHTDEGHFKDYEKAISRIKADLNDEFTHYEDSGIKISKIEEEIKKQIANGKFPTPKIKELSKTILKLKILDEKSFILNTNKGQKEWPITKFELPYKMFLSPLADPPDNRAEGDEKKPYDRPFGAHIFRQNNDPRLEYERDGLTIYKPWENEMVFQNLEGEESSPRFKVVGWLSLSESQDQDKVELLPAPVHRNELHHLTMQPNYNRDVLSKYFNLSVLGGSTYLKYRNDKPFNFDAQRNPINYSTVAWEQDVKFARDNYVSITFRAVDTFTGLKLLVSIIAQRRFKYGVSFLQKRYFVTHAEKEKDFTLKSEKVRSRLPYDKIIPLSPGVFFDPHQLNGTSTSYVVRSEDAEGKPYKPNQLLTFDYIGIDKKGRRFPFTQKMTIIPAESYEITEGEYEFPNDPKSPYKKGETVSFKSIGLLDPKLDERYLTTNKPDPDPPPYKYKLNKNFTDTTERAKIIADLKVIEDHLKDSWTDDDGSSYDNYETFKLDVKDELTYSRLIKLKGEKADIDKNSESSSFKTRDLLLHSDLGEVVDNPEKDSFNQNFPLLPKLQEANVIVSQIDQMEGISRYRKVRYAEVYFEGTKEIDEEYPANQAKLLFMFTKWNSTKKAYEEDPIKSFFTENYKSAGAMVNPGIPISHVSVKDQGITYNQSHNPVINKTNGLIDSRSKNVNLSVNGNFESVKSVSVFGELDAEILGISLLDIVQDAFPIKDLPVFNYLKEGKETLDKLKKIAITYEELFKKWQKEYNDATNEFNRLKKLLKELDKKLLALAKREARGWLDELIEQSEIKNHLTYQQQFIEAQLANYNAAVKEIKTKIHTKYPALAQMEFDNRVKAINDVAATIKTSTANGTILKPNKEELSQMTNKVKSLIDYSISSNVPKELIKEAVKIYCIAQFAANREIDIEQKISLFARIILETDQAQDYLNQITTAYREAAYMSKQYVKKELAKVSEDIKENLGNIKKDFDDGLDSVITSALRNSPFLDPNNIELALFPLMEIVNIYENHQKIYANLRAGLYNELNDRYDLNIPSSATNFNLLEDHLINQLKQRLQKEAIDGTEALKRTTAYARVKIEYNNLREGLEGEIATSKRWMSEYEQMIRTEITLASGIVLPLAQQIDNTISKYTEIVYIIDKEYEDKKKEVLQALNDLKEIERKIKDFVKIKIEEQKTLLEEELKKLASTARGTEAYRNIQSNILEMRSIIRKLDEASHQKLNYTHTTTNFRRASLGGIIEFVPARTRLDIDVNYEIQLEIDQFDKPPDVVKQEFLTNSTLSDFKLTFLKLISIDFDRVTFKTGSSVKDDFIVNIRDVQFAGSLSFVQKFQEFLKTLDPNLVFNITSSYAQVGYGISLPDFPAGYFNFFNFNLNALLTLPFEPKKSLQLQFGFGSDLNKFGITVAAIFGGQGYFNLIAEPKRGIVGMILVLEFGAIFSLNLFVASGTAYLVGGIYIKRYSGNYDIRGYILCVGRFNVLGLFSAGMSFYLGLRGNGSELYGECVVTVTKKFSSFFKISVSCRMEKKIKGAKNNGSNQKSFAKSLITTSGNYLDPTGIELIDGNLDLDSFYDDEFIYLTFKDTDVAQEVKESFRSNERNLKAIIKQDGLEVYSQQLIFSTNRGSAGTLYFFELELSELSTEGGDHTLSIVDVDNNEIIEDEFFKVIREEIETEERTAEVKGGASRKEYYRSYYPNRA